MARSYKFALLRLSPDRVRGELLNIGIVVFRDRNLDVRLLSNWRKLNAVISEDRSQHLVNLPETINKLVSGVESDDERVATLNAMGVIQLSPIGMFELRQDESYDDALVGMLRRYVEPPHQKRTERKSTRLNTDIKAAFNRSNILGHDPADISKHLVVPHYKLENAPHLTVDFAVKNGVYHFTETVDFRVRSGIPTIKMKETGLSSVVLDQAKKMHADCKNYFVYAATAMEEWEIRDHIQMASSYADEVFNFESDREKSAYLDLIMTATGGQLWSHVN